LLPNPTDLDTKDLQISPAAVEELLTVNPRLWQEEFAGIGKYLEQFGDRVPPPLKTELQGALERVHSSQV
jgi:phosphoenolpyruvate carboxykinase (GTP)